MSSGEEDPATTTTTTSTSTTPIARADEDALSKDSASTNDDRATTTTPVATAATPAVAAAEKGHGEKHDETTRGTEEAAAEDEEDNDDDTDTTSRTTMKNSPLIILVIGMAGTGKTTLVQQLQQYSNSKNLLSYFVNLDPAVAELPYGCHVDIRDTVNYREVMKQYRLGPNGAILTALNLFATKFHQLIDLLERRRESLDWIVMDTPGQIEVFTWSASGQLIAEALSSTFPTCLLFVGDTTRCANPQTFMSTMMYSSSIMFKTQLPLLVAFNKTDITRPDLIMSWMRDNEAFTDALQDAKGYATTLTESLSLFVNEFYRTLDCTAVSAATGANFEDLERCLTQAKQKYINEFLPLIRDRLKLANEVQARRQQQQEHRVQQDASREESV